MRAFMSSLTEEPGTLPKRCVMPTWLGGAHVIKLYGCITFNIIYPGKHVCLYVKWSAFLESDESHFQIKHLCLTFLQGLVACCIFYSLCLKMLTETNWAKKKKQPKFSSAPFHYFVLKWLQFFLYFGLWVNEMFTSQEGLGVILQLCTECLWVSKDFLLSGKFICVVFVLGNKSTRVNYWVSNQSKSAEKIWTVQIIGLG